MNVKTIVIAVLVILSLVILFQNTQTATLRFLFWEVTVSRIILIPLFVGMGFIIGYVAAKMGKRKPRKGKQD